MSRFERRLKKSLSDPQHRAAYFAADAEAELTSAINAARNSLGISQRELGVRLEKSQAAVSQFLNAQDGFTVERLVEYLLGLGLCADVAIKRSYGEGAPVRVSLDVEARGDNVLRMDRSAIHAAMRKEPPTRASFGKLRSPSKGSVRRTLQPGAA